MSDKFESISALMDAESTELEVRRTLKGVAGDSELSDTWRRYHLAQALIKGQKIDSMADISAGVMAAIDKVDQASTDIVNKSLSKDTTASSGRWYQTAASMAVAASVTFAVLLGVQNYSFDANSSGTRQAGLIERSNANLNANVLPTSLAGQQANADDTPSIEVIRLSEDMRGSIDSYKLALSAMDASWAPSWLPEGYSEKGLQLSAQGTTRLYQNGDLLLTLAVQPLGEIAPKAGSFSDQGVTALGRVVDDHFVSVVGELSLNDADRVISSLNWSSESAK